MAKQSRCETRTGQEFRYKVRGKTSLGRESKCFTSVFKCFEQYEVTLDWVLDTMHLICRWAAFEI